MYQILKNKFGENEAESLVAFVKEEVQTNLKVTFLNLLLKKMF